MSEHPPAELAADLWMALDLPIDEFNGYYERNGWADTWAALGDRVRQLSGRGRCWEPAGYGERCVLRVGVGGKPHFGPHYGSSDVGSGEPLPTTEGAGA